MSKNITQKDIQNFVKNRPHVFILGAGASKAALPNGDRNGLDCPVMDGFLQKTGLTTLLDGIQLKTNSNNLEDIYSELHDCAQYREVTTKLEQGIIEYFHRLALPYEPTIYDYLLLSLRKKDCIFTFNWDDLIVQSYLRLYRITTDLPKIFFLHGNVSMGYCYNCEKLIHIADKYCPICDKKLQRQKLLFPIKNKDYTKDKSISNAWDSFLKVLSDCSVLTIFGYGAPPSDAEAIKLMQQAFSSTFRRLDSIEIIDIKDKNILYEDWKPFIRETNDHVHFYDSLFDSIIGKFPRRSIEGYELKTQECWFGDSAIHLQQSRSIYELADLFKPLFDNEANNDYSVIPI